MSVVDEIISRMVEACGLKNTAQMLRFIEVSSGAAGLWKKREKVPDGSLAKVSERTGVSVGWLKTGEETTQEPRQGRVSEPQQDYGPILDKELFIEVIKLLEEIEEVIGRRPAPQKKAELAWLLYKRYAAGEKMGKAEVVELIRLAS